MKCFFKEMSVFIFKSLKFGYVGLWVCMIEWVGVGVSIFFSVKLRVYSIIGGFLYLRCFFELWESFKNKVFYV